MTSHTTPLISLPYKSTTETDFATPIRQTIAQTYGERPDGYTEDIATLSRCRGDAVKGAGSDTTARDLLLKYFGQLELLELRFAETKIAFQWIDAYTHQPTTQTSLAFEKASVLHLLSSVLSHLGATAPRTSPEGIKRSYAALRQSAGLLHFINENFLHAPSTDLSRDIVSFSAQLVLTQAGEVFLDKCINEKKPKPLVIKMCQSVAQGYSGLQEDAKEFQGKGTLDRNWVSVITIKAKYFASLAQYYRAQIDMDKGEYGPGMVRYQLADRLATESHKSAKEFNYYYSPGAESSSGDSESGPPRNTLPSDAALALLEITKAHQTLTSEAKEQANKDNDLVYHAVPPSEASLAAIEPLPASSMAAPITIQEIYAQPTVSALIGPDIFRRLVPLEVHEKASVYSEEKAKLVRAEQEKCDISESETRTSLEHLKVRSKLAAYRSIIDGASGADEPGASARGQPPSAVLQYAEEIQSRERREGPVEHILQKIEQRRNQLESDLSQCLQEMDEESRECEKLRAKHGHLWAQPPSSSQNRRFKDEINSHRNSLMSASASDRSIQETWAKVRADAEILQQPSPSSYSGHGGPLSKMYSDADAGRNHGPEAAVNLLDVDVSQDEVDDREKQELRGTVDELAERLERIHKVGQERDQVLKDLKEKIQTDDVSNLLILNRRCEGVEPTLFATELEKFAPYQNRISAAIASQIDLIEEMGALIKKAESGRGVREAQSRMSGSERRRADLDRRFTVAYEGYMDVRGNMDKATQFYDSLATLVDTLKRSVRSFVSSRIQEKNRLLDTIERSRSSSPGAQSQSPSRGLDGALAGLSIGGAPPVSRPPGPTSPYPPLMSSPPPPSSSSHSPFPPPSQSSHPSLPPPPQRLPSNPYDFSSLGSLPSAFASQQPTGAASSTSMSPNSSSGLPPPPTHYSSSYASYGAPPPSSHAPYPPPPGHLSSPTRPHPPTSTHQSLPPSSAYSQPPPASHNQPAPSSYPSYPLAQSTPYPPPPPRPSQPSYTTGYPGSFPPPPPSQPSQAQAHSQPLYGQYGQPPPPPPPPAPYNGSPFNGAGQYRY